MTNSPIYITIADDDEDDRIFFEDAIKELKMNTKINMVKDGVALIEDLQSQKNNLPDVIFLDLNMPKKSGMECLREIKANPFWKNIAIAIYSTSASEEDIEETFVQGANIYIKKPNDFNTLKKMLSDVLTINWQYQTSNLNRDNFLLRL